MDLLRDFAIVSCIPNESISARRESKLVRENAMTGTKKKRATVSLADELRQRLDREDLESRWKLEAFDNLLTESQSQPAKFLRHWVTPLMSAGLSLDAAVSVLIEGHFRPN